MKATMDLSSCQCRGYSKVFVPLPIFIVKQIGSLCFKALDGGKVKKNPLS
jgi:hypothetical protein